MLYAELYAKSLSLIFFSAFRPGVAVGYCAYQWGQVQKAGSPDSDNKWVHGGSLAEICITGSAGPRFGFYAKTKRSVHCRLHSSSVPSRIVGGFFFLDSIHHYGRKEGISAGSCEFNRIQRARTCCHSTSSEWTPDKRVVNT